MVVVFKVGHNAKGGGHPKGVPAPLIPPPPPPRKKEFEERQKQREKFAVKLNSFPITCN